MAKAVSKVLRRATPLGLTPVALSLAACGSGGEDSTDSSDNDIDVPSTGGDDEDTGSSSNDQSYEYEIIPSFGVSRSNSQALVAFSERGSTTFDVSQINSSEDRISFISYDFSTNEVRLSDLNNDGFLTAQTYLGGENPTPITDVIIFNYEGEIYDFVSEQTLSDYDFYLFAKDTGNVFLLSLDGSVPSIERIIEFNDSINGISIDGRNAVPEDLIISLAEVTLEGEDLVVEGATTSSEFSNSYTLTVADIPARFLAIAEQLAQVGQDVIENISNYIQWQGVLDFAIQFDDRGSFGPGGFFSTDDSGPGMPSLPFDAGNGYLVAHYEALFGVDLNGDDFDLGTNLLPDSLGNLTNYGKPIYINTNQDPENDSEVPDGYHDFFSVFTHEILHTMGIMSIAWGTQINNLIEIEDGEQFYIGENVVDLVGGRVPFNDSAHFGELPNGTSGGLMYEYGLYDGRWEFGQFELAVFKDLGYNVAGLENLPILDIDNMPLF